MCKTCVFSYSKELGNRDWYVPHSLDRTITVRVCDKSIYLFHPVGHYDLVSSTVKVPSEFKVKIFAMTALNLMQTK